MSEEWRGVLFFPGYEVSSLGRVRSIGYGILKMPPNKKGYLRVCLYRDRRPFVKFVHFLVCQAFHGPKPDWATEVAHRNHLKPDNTKKNVRWATREQNLADGTLRGPLRGEDSSNVILTEQQVAEIKRQYATERATVRIKRGVRTRLAQQFGVSPQTIDAITQGRNWKVIA